MAKRIGKYKISSKESALSLGDGGTVSGNLTVTGTILFTGISAGGEADASTGQLFTTTSNAISGANTQTTGDNTLKLLCIK